MRKTVLALVAVALTTPVHAQIMPNAIGDGVHRKTDVEVKQEQEREAGYRSGISKIPDAKGKVDPWGGVRNATAPAQNQSRSNPK